MSAATGKDWREGFGVSGRKPPEFFHHKDDLEKVAASASQAHALRRAFDTMKLDGIACLDGVPMIYFREMARIEAEAVRALLRQFWNQGIAPILVLISGDEIHVYSSLAPTVSDVEDVTKPECLVTTLNRVSDAAGVARLVLSVESGEFFRANAKAFDPSRRVDRELLRNLRATREEMDKAAAPKLKDDILDALLCRLVFTCYLFDRGVIKPSYLDDLGATGIEHLRDVLALQPWTEAKQKLYALFRKLGGDFNGDLFSDDLDKEEDKVGERQLEILNLFFHGTDVQSRQARFWPYNFRDVPIETISAIYEHFLKAADAEAKHEDGAFYTPRFLAELVLDVALEGAGSLLDKRFLDPSCGSGIFLVGLFNRLAEEWKRANPQARYDRRARELMGVLKNNLFGVDKNKTACRIASFSLYLAFLDQLAPPDIEELQRKKKFLPKLLWTPEDKDTDGRGETILCADFFSTADIIPSTRPTRQRLDVPTLTHAINSRRKSYTARLLSLLNQRAAKSAFEVHGEQFADEEAGVGMVVLEKTLKGEEPKGLPSKAADTVAAVERLQRETARSYSSFELTRGVKVFHKSLLLLLKPLGERFWTNTAALNDADEIAQSIAMKSERVGV